MSTTCCLSLMDSKDNPSKVSQVCPDFHLRSLKKQIPRRNNIRMNFKANSEIIVIDISCVILSLKIFSRIFFFQNWKNLKIHSSAGPSKFKQF